LSRQRVLARHRLSPFRAAFGMTDTSGRTASTTMMWKSVLLAVVLSLMGATADSVLKVASEQSRPFWNRWFLLGMLLSSAFAVLWVLLVQLMKLATAGIFCAVMSMLLLIGIGVIGFGERLNETESAGVVMALIAVVLLGRVTS
jgi:drug/metabolite transporter (DMT)-like permease